MDNKRKEIHSSQDDALLEPETGQISSLRDEKHSVILDALVAHIIELMRHFGSPTYKACRQTLDSAIIKLDRIPSETRWGIPCESWRCTFCFALNDDEDDVCEVCKIYRADSDIDSSSVI